MFVGKRLSATMTRSLILSGGTSVYSFLKLVDILLTNVTRKYLPLFGSCAMPCKYTTFIKFSNRRQS